MSFEFIWWGSYQRNSPGANNQRGTCSRAAEDCCISLRSSGGVGVRNKKKKYKKIYWRGVGSLFNLLLKICLIDEHVFCRVLCSFHFSLDLCLVNLTFPHELLSPRKVKQYTLIYKKCQEITRVCKHNFKKNMGGLRRLQENKAVLSRLSVWVLRTMHISHSWLTLDWSI